MKKRKKEDSRIPQPVSVRVEPSKVTGWTFLTNHTHVLLCLYRNPEITLREVAVLVGITERMVQKIVADIACGASKNTSGWINRLRRLRRISSSDMKNGKTSRKYPARPDSV